MRRILSAVVVTAVLVAVVMGAATATSPRGQSYETFLQYYRDGIQFINDNDSRHLLPLVIASRESEEGDGRLVYELLGDTLQAVIITEASGEVIESCIITLTAPASMEYGNAIYNDFAISGYHSYALLMAMYADPVPANRYQLVLDVEEGLSGEEGSYTRQVGVYTLQCTRRANVVSLEFYNTRIPQPPPGEEEPPSEENPAESEAPEEPDEEEAASML